MDFGLRLRSAQVSDWRKKLRYVDTARNYQICVFKQITICETHYDAIIIGGGHNGLTTAAYLAKAGKKVLVLERRHVLGGAAVTEEIYPGL